jgi:hypothetical protein
MRLALAGHTLFFHVIHIPNSSHLAIAADDAATVQGREAEQAYETHNVPIGD